MRYRHFFAFLVLGVFITAGVAIISMHDAYDGPEFGLKRAAGFPLRVFERWQDGSPGRYFWVPFAINTLFYAGVLWMLFAGPFALRRKIRRRRSRCPQCAYPIGQSPVCTECGAAVMVPDC